MDSPTHIQADQDELSPRKPPLSPCKSQRSTALSLTHILETTVPSSTPTKVHEELRNRKRRTRTVTSPEQTELLMQVLRQTSFPSTEVRERLASMLGMTPRAVQVWFQNQRQKAKNRRRAVLQHGPTGALPTVPSRSAGELRPTGDPALLFNNRLSNDSMALGAAGPAVFPRDPLNPTLLPHSLGYRGPSFPEAERQHHYPPEGPIPRDPHSPSFYSPTTRSPSSRTNSSTVNQYIPPGYLFSSHLPPGSPSGFPSVPVLDPTSPAFVQDDSGANQPPPLSEAIYYMNYLDRTPRVQLQYTHEGSSSNKAKKKLRLNPPDVPAPHHQGLDRGPRDLHLDPTESVRRMGAAGDGEGGGSPPSASILPHSSPLPPVHPPATVQLPPISALTPNSPHRTSFTDHPCTSSHHSPSSSVGGSTNLGKVSLTPLPSPTDYHSPSSHRSLADLVSGTTSPTASTHAFLDSSSPNIHPAGRVGDARVIETNVRGLDPAPRSWRPW
ncbi:hypothetical protein IWQ62_000052 [Dispira parvispora]|uniref:Homeobox domain-containing protein n=1 Tax=Dispira parvispora TaxID=1520584 RepID=A0A9W8EA15_9FUNG|nr:hypothetical protein IWQ62_000052 [Dispira parvispora]